MSETMTVNVEKEVATEFRKQASIKYGKKKGHLGKALTDAMKEWAKKRSESNEAKFLELLHKGIKVKHHWEFDRSEAHER